MGEHIIPCVAVVDDDPSMRAAMTSLIRSFGCEAKAFPSAAAFLRYRDVPRVVCAVVDVCMPDTSGLALQDELLASRPEIPVIMMSAHDDEVTRSMAMRRGAVAFLRKPFSDQTLQATLLRALSKPSEMESSREIRWHPPRR
jgi:FixJ family two-component response regulator